MNFIHQATLNLPAHSYLHRLTFPQVKVSDPKIGCGHTFKLVNEWTLRKALYSTHWKRAVNSVETFPVGNNNRLALFEVKKMEAVVAAGS